MNSEKKYYLYPSFIKVTRDPIQIHTILGSCVAVCLYDPSRKIGGMNHFMLPLWNGKGLASPKYGNIAMQKLLSSLLDHGALRNKIIAKVFGGANVLEFNAGGTHIGQRNIELALSTLDEMKIKVVAKSTGGELGRKIIFDVADGKVHQRMIDKVKMKTMPVPEAKKVER
jgi:chemotaxis protein CheD